MLTGPPSRPPPLPPRVDPKAAVKSGNERPSPRKNIENVPPKQAGKPEARSPVHQGVVAPKKVSPRAKPCGNFVAHLWKTGECRECGKSQSEHGGAAESGQDTELNKRFAAIRIARLQAQSAASSAATNQAPQLPSAPSPTKLVRAERLKHEALSNAHSTASEAINKKKEQADAQSKVSDRLRTEPVRKPEQAVKLTPERVVPRLTTEAPTRQAPTRVGGKVSDVIMHMSERAGAEVERPKPSAIVSNRVHTEATKKPAELKPEIQVKGNDHSNIGKLKSVWEQKTKEEQPSVSNKPSHPQPRSALQKPQQSEPPQRPQLPHHQPQSHLQSQSHPHPQPQSHPQGQSQARSQQSQSQPQPLSQHVQPQIQVPPKAQAPQAQAPQAQAHPQARAQPQAHPQAHSQVAHPQAHSQVVQPQAQPQAHKEGNQVIFRAGKLGSQFAEKNAEVKATKVEQLFTEAKEKLQQQLHEEEQKTPEQRAREERAQQQEKARLEKLRQEQIIKENQLKAEKKQREILEMEQKTREEARALQEGAALKRSVAEESARIKEKFQQLMVQGLEKRREALESEVKQQQSQNPGVLSPIKSEAVCLDYKPHKWMSNKCDTCLGSRESHERAGRVSMPAGGTLKRENALSLERQKIVTNVVGSLKYGTLTKRTPRKAEKPTSPRHSPKTNLAPVILNLCDAYEEHAWKPNTCKTCKQDVSTHRQQGLAVKQKAPVFRPAETPAKSVKELAANAKMFKIHVPNSQSPLGLPSQSPFLSPSREDSMPIYPEVIPLDFLLVEEGATPGSQIRKVKMANKRRSRNTPKFAVPVH